MKLRPVFALFLLLAGTLLLAMACKPATATEYTIDHGSCNGCGECLRICPNDAIYINVSGKAVIDLTKCTNCAECVAVCPNSAIY